MAWPVGTTARRHAAAALMVLLTAACGPMVASTPPAEPPVPAAAPVPVSPPTGPPRQTPDPIRRIPPTSLKPGPVDPILDSPWAKHPEMVARVQEWILSFQGREEPLFRATLERMGRYQGTVEEEIQRQALPASLSFLPIVESWYNPRAVSWVGAAGLWQFMPPTGRAMGLRVDGLVDERRDPYLSTPLALSYLADLNRRFGSWFLALAAYNGGPGRLDRILRDHGWGSNGHDGLFLTILQDLPRETRDFVPRFLAAATVARDPAAFGFGDVVPDAPLAFDQVEVPDATSLDVVALASGVPQDVVEGLNPQLLRGLTPAGQVTRLRLPPGTGDAFTVAYREIPPQERVTFVEHAVAKGETLTHVARMYGVSVGDLQAANPSVQPRRMQIGQRLVVPKAPSERDRLRRSVASGPVAQASSAEQQLVVYRVQPGDTLSGIAARHRVSVGDLLQWNSLTRRSVIYPGDEVRIYLSGG